MPHALFNAKEKHSNLWPIAVLNELSDFRMASQNLSWAQNWNQTDIVSCSHNFCYKKIVGAWHDICLVPSLSLSCTPGLFLENM